MITKGEFEKKSVIYNRKIEPSDWRYSAAIVGMIRFFKDRDISYCFENRYLYYKFEDIYSEAGDLESDKNYLLFAEKYFTDRMHHKEIERNLDNKELTEQEISELNKKL